MCTYLSKRGATYYFRRAIPIDLRAAFAGRVEFVLSLRTKDRDQAKRLIPDRTKKTDQLLDEARQRLDAPAEVVRPASGPALSEFEIEQAEWAAQDNAERQARREAREALLPRLEDALALSTAVITPREARLRDLLRDLHMDLTIEQERSLAKRVLRAEERRGTRSRPAVEAISKSLGVSTLGAATKTHAIMLDTTIVDLWAAERKVVQKGIDTHRGVARWFYERVGRKAVDQIARQDVLAFKDSLIAEQTPANTNMKLSRLQTLLQWAEDNDYREGNPAKGIRVLNADAACQTAFKRDPRSASKRDPLFG